MILRHKDTQEAFMGYDFNIEGPKKRSDRRDFDPFTHTSTSIRKKK
jgi:hypothetical protein